MTPASPAALFGDLLARTVRGGARRRLRRLREPRYLLATALAIAYFSMVLVRPMVRPGGAPPPLRAGELPPSVLLVAAFALTALAMLAWVFKAPRASLPLSEAEAQFLFPAPLGRRGVVRYALLRGQLAILAGAAVLSLVGRGAGGFRSFLPAWMLLAVINLHAQGVGFTKARWSELPPGRRAAAFGSGLLVPLAVLALAFAGLLAGLGKLPLPALAAHLADATLFPARLLLRPLLRVASAPPLALLLPPAALVVLHFLWVDGSAARFEEATLADAARRAEMRARRTASGMASRPGGNREATPFPLAGTGRPEVAILWKNLLAVRRTPLVRQAALLAAVVALFGIASGVLVAREPARLLAVQTGVLVCAVAGALLALLSAFTQREDFRSDLLHAEALRTWPLPPHRIAAGELAAPLFTSTVRLVTGLLAGLALSVGGAVGLRASRAFVAFPHDHAMGIFTRPSELLPLLGAALLSVPPLVALLLVAQNAASLAFPAWFPAGPRRSAGPEVTGMQLIAFLGTFLAVAVALVPAAVVTGAAAWLGRGLGAAWLPALGPVAAVPMAVEAALGLRLLGALLARYDPALDAGP